MERHEAGAVRTPDDEIYVDGPDARMLREELLVATEVAVGDIKGVRLTNGCEVAIAWPSTKGNPYLANFTLGGTGTLTVKEYGGDSIKSTNFTTAGDLSYEIESPNENTGLTFTYSGEDGDYATLLPFRGNSGLIINIR